MSWIQLLWCLSVCWKVGSKKYRNVLQESFRNLSCEGKAFSWLSLIALLSYILVISYPTILIPLLWLLTCVHHLSIFIYIFGSFFYTLYIWVSLFLLFSCLLHLPILYLFLDHFPFSSIKLYTVFIRINWEINIIFTLNITGTNNIQGIKLTMS